VSCHSTSPIAAPRSWTATWTRLGGTTDFALRKGANDAVVREANEQAISIWLHDTPYAIITQRVLRGLNNFRLHPFGNFASKPWWGDIWLQR
jgi:hypothetical protein